MIVKKASLFISILIIITGAFLPLQAEGVPLQENIENYKKVISERVSSFAIYLYPEEARKNGWEGIATVKFIVKKDGSLEGIETKKSSGYPLLDRAARWAVESASPYPFPFTDIEAIEIELPLGFGSPQQEPKEEKTPAPRMTPQEYTQSLSEKVSFFLVCPREIREIEAKRIVKVNFLIKKDGSVGNLKIKESSGSSQLDKAALLAVESATPLPSPIDIGKEELEVNLPLDFGPLKPDIKYAKLLKEKKGKKEALTQMFPSSKKEEKRKKEIDKSFEVPRLLLEEKPTKKIEVEDELTIDNGYTEKAGVRAGLHDALVPTKPGQTGIEGRLQMSDVYSKSLPSELTEFIGIAIDNYQPLQIAKEEVTLAKMKIREAARSIFPNLKVEAYTTEGDVYKVEYEEEELKVNLDQPIYYGGRLRNAYRQAKVNLEITKRNYDQRVLDTIHKTEVAYYTLITLRMNLEKQNEIVTEAKKILDVTEKQYQRGVIIPLEFSNVKSWYERLRLLRDSINQELDLAHLTLQQVLNTEVSPPVSLLSLDIEEFDIGLQGCIDEALISRPEIALADLSVKFYEYGKKMEDAKETFNVDFTGNHAWYRGHYLTEDWKSAENWYFGIKVTKPLGASTGTVSYAKEKAQPRYGQTSATQSKTISGELGVLDNLKRKSENKDAEIALLNAENQSDETRKNVIFEAQDAFFKYQKSLLELKSALTQKNFRENELKVSKIRAYRGEGSFPGLIQTLLNLSDAENTYLRALGNYYISWATLRKATGYGLKI